MIKHNTLIEIVNLCEGKTGNERILALNTLIENEIENEIEKIILIAKREELNALKDNFDKYLDNRSAIIEGYTD